MTSTLTATTTDVLVDPSLMVENKVCPGCKKTVVTEDGSVVVAFGQSLFHVDCFKCAKCNNQVTADTNLLLLSDGSPVCANCSYCCNVCGQPILDEAIMTGDDAYHAHCFNCKVCKKRIDELVFAKTSQGIYCMDCHNERVARSRRHQQRREKEKERERAREKAAGESSSVKSKESAPREGSIDGSRNSRGENGLKSRTGSMRSKTRPGTAQSTDQTSSSSSSKDPGRRVSVSSMGERINTQSPPQLHHSASLPPPASIASAPASAAVPASGSKRYSTMLLPPSSTSPVDHARSATLPISSGEQLAVPNENTMIQKRKSFQDKPLNVLLKENNLDIDSTSGLSVPNGSSTRKDKRRSINPVFALSYSASQDSSTALSRSQTPPVQPHTSSPRQENFNIPSTLSPPPFTDSPKLNASHLPPTNEITQINGLIGRSRSASSAGMTFDPSRGMDQNAGLRPPVRPSITLDRVPARTSSRQDLNSPARSQPPPLEGRQSPSTLNVHNNALRTQRSFDDRYRPGTAPSALRTSGSSGELKRDASSRPSSSGSRPASPPHRADVPHGIESGTDTEAELEVTRLYGSDEDRPPIPPPKEVKKSKAGTRPPDLKLDTVIDIRDDGSDAGQPDSEISSEMSPEEEPVQQTSHSTFIAPALPPIRFSMGAADFSELLKSVEGPQSLKSISEVNGNGSAKLRVDTSRTKGSSTSNGQLSTPTSEITIIGSDPGHADVTPVKRREPERRDTDMTIRRERSPSRSHSTSPLSPGATQNHNHYDTLPRASGERAKRSLDGYSEGTSTLRSLDIPSPRQRSYSASRSEHSPRPSLDNRFTHSREKTEPSVSITLTPAEDGESARPDPVALVKQRLQEAMNDAKLRGAEHIKLNMEFVNAIMTVMDQRGQEFHEMKRRLDGMKRASQQYMDGLTVAQTEYDKELRARRDAEAEVTRLRIILSGQAARLTAISGETRKQEAQKALSRDLSDSLSVLQRDLSKLRVERDMTLAEVEELSASRSSSTIESHTDSTAKLGRSLSVRFDNIKDQYAAELLPLNQRRENILREIEELKASRDAFLEETTMLNARNEELAQLNAQYIRRMEASGMELPPLQEILGDKPDIRTQLALNASATSSTVAFSDESADRYIKITKQEIPEHPTPQAKGKFKWPGKAAKDLFWPDKNKNRAEHSFVQISVLRVARCDHCGDKMWGSQLRCSNCSIAVHTRCVHQVHLPCSQQTNGHRDETAGVAINGSVPSMFGRDLIEQVRADWRDEQHYIPVIVEKCIDAVDLLGLEYEGIYRKTGGSRLSKQITQLFESGDYSSFDLRDTDRFNDICSITSVLKTYFRSLPNPLLTFELHEKFVAAAGVKDTATKATMMGDLVQELPTEHYHTLRSMMLHLHRVCQRSETNLMHARNLGVVFGPTLMRSRDPNAEFSDMAGKALSIEFLVENAPTVFSPPS